MRFREFKSINEAIPAVTRKDLSAVGPNVLSAVQKLGKKTSDTIAVAAGQKDKASTTDIQIPPGMQKQMQVQPNAIQAQKKELQQKQAQAKIAPKMPTIPVVGSQLVLPDRDTKQPASYTIKAQQGNDITLDPVKNNPNDPRVNVIVKKKDLQTTLAAVDPNNKVGTK